MTLDLTSRVIPATFDVALEAFPADVRRTLDRRAAWRRWLARSNEALEFIVDNLERWTPGSTVTVAFKGGDAALHERIADATTQLTEAGNIELDFGLDASNGAFRSWSERDAVYGADVRVSFDQPGFWSLAGMDSLDPTVGVAGGLVGGRPHQRTMNFGGFDHQLPELWERTVRREFMHALAFNHQHQSVRGVGQNEFRWQDDDGYVRTRENGSFVPDAEGRRPGIYTYMSGAPNNWTREMVERNLRTIDRVDHTAVPLDPASIMLYRFPALFYRSSPSPCAPHGDGIDLSDGDKRGLAALYPHSAAEINELVTRAKAARQALAERRPAPEDGWAVGAEVLLDRFLKGPN